MSEIKKRNLVSRIYNFIEDKEIIVIHGSRQVGKTCLLQYIINNLKISSTEDSNIFYFDLEDFRLLDLCNTSTEDVISYLKAKGADFNKRVYLFIDEVQYLYNPSSFLKLFYDRHKERVKLIVSGSSSFLIKKKFKDSLVGRILDFELFPLDFKEFLEFKGLKYELKAELPDILQEELKRLYTEFILFGGYPAIVLEDDREKKEIKVKQIINTYIKKDIRDMADIRDIDKFNDLIKTLASQTGSLLNILELSNIVGLAKKTVKEYIFLLENTYIIRRIRPFHKNVRSELTKMPKIFFEDSGLVNILTNKTFSLKVDGGLLENSIYSQLRKILSVDDIYFWRTNKKQEVDFIIDFVDRDRKKILLAIEVKNIFLNKYTANLRYLKKEYGEISIYFCCFEKKETARDKHISLVYPWQLAHILNLQ